MPEPSEFSRSSEHHVTVVLVTHDGERWLRPVLDGVFAQTLPWQRLAVADTGSLDATLELLHDRVPPEQVIHLPRPTGYGAAVKAAVQRSGSDGPAAPVDLRHQWLWLLHDDSEPEPQALEHLLAAVEADPGLGVVGTKIRGWYDRRVLLEVGVTIDAGGRRETSLERGEQDQGQHDNRRETLAVSSAGMLVRRDVWDTLGGFDPHLPLLRDDVDLCWRAWLAGHRVAVVPAAVVHHAEASARERRRIDAGPGRLHLLDRAGALRVLLANLSTTAFLLALPRLLVGSLVRATAYLVAKAPRDAADELLAVGTVLIRPRAVLRMRRTRRTTHEVMASSLRRLFPPAGHQLGLAAEALTHAIGGRRVGREAIGRHRVAEPGSDAGFVDELDAGAGGMLLRRVVRSPAVVLGFGLSVLTLLAERHLLRGGRLLGGALLPAPHSLGQLAATWSASWHADGLGSPVAAPPYLGLLSVGGVLTFGQPSLLVSILLLAAVPAAGASAYWASSGLPAARAFRLWGAAAYALAPTLTGALAAGRLGTCFAVVLLPLWVRAGVRAVGTPGRAGTDRAAWTFALLSTVLIAFVPLVWVLLVAPGVVVAVCARSDGSLRRRAAIALLAPPVALLPWSAHLLRHPVRLLIEPGPTGPGLSDRAHSVVRTLLLNPGGPGSGPGLLGFGVVAAGLVGLAVSRDRGIVLLAWAFAIDAYLVALVASRVSVAAPAGGHPAAAWPGVAVAAAQAAVTVAAVVGCRDVPHRLRRRDFGVAQPLAAGLLLAAVAAPVLAGAAWLWRGADGPLHRGSADTVPANVAAESATSDRPRTLVLRSTGGTPDPTELSYALVRGAGPRLGAVDESVPAAAYAALRSLVGDLVSARGDDVAPRLADFAIRYVEVRAPVAGSVAQALDSVPGLERLGASGDHQLWRLALPTARLTILAPGNATAVALPSGATSATAQLPPGPGGRVLALAEPVDSHWTARLAGAALRPAERDGWAQSWSLPPAGGELTLRYTDHLRGLGVAWQGLALLVLVVLALPAAAARAQYDAEPAPVASGAGRHALGEEAAAEPPAAAAAGALR
jgi:GT2 family glycosyltransferase